MAGLEIEHAERIATLETKMQALTDSVREQTTKIDELLGIVQQARGARFALVGVGVISGGLLTLVVDYAHKAASIFGALAK